MTAPSDVGWGDWMASYKAAAAGAGGSNDAGAVSAADQEAERIDRQKAAFGSDTIARIKDLNVLLVGCRGVGVETAKNLILSNVGAVVIHDPAAVRMADLGSNFYLRESHVLQGVSRAAACLGELKTLNPYCKVECLEPAAAAAAASSSAAAPALTEQDVLNPNVLGTGKPFRAIVVTQLLPQQELFQLNEWARQNNMAFILAVTSGVTCSLFSDFGPHHEITDPNGEPAVMLAVSNMEVIEYNQDNAHLLTIDGVDQQGTKVVIVTVAQADHGLDDGNVVQLDDMRQHGLESLNGRQLEVKRVAFCSPEAAAVDTADVAFQESLKYPTATLLPNWQRQYAHYHAEWEQSAAAAADTKKKFPVRTITLLNRLALVLPNDITPDLFAKNRYQSGGLLNQIRQPMVMTTYRSLQETLEKTVPVPQMLRSDDWEAGRGIDVHLGLAAILQFQAQTSRWPGLHDEADAAVVLKLAQEISASRQAAAAADSQTSYCWSQTVSFYFPTGEARDLDAVRIQRYARLLSTELTGFCAFLGGAAAQEVLKATGKFTPLNQWIHHDEHVLVTDESWSNITPMCASPEHVGASRYHDQMAILGKDFQARVAQQRVFLVGCGALGCEYLKGLALMGVATAGGGQGKIVVTDMDQIEVSNLSRQFLFRNADVGNPKSVSGARVVQSWNPAIHIEALEKRVGTDSEDMFDDSFWESLTVCWNALDNVMARKYTDGQCLFYSKPLLESGTLGTKCNHEVILPYRTSSYNDGKESDDNENQIAMCTLRSFPYLPLHCIEFAKQAYFSDYFEFGPEQYETFRQNFESFFEQLEAMEPGEQLKSLQAIDYYVRLQQTPTDSSSGGKKTIDFGTCVRIAFERMTEDFRTSILNLLHAADEMEKQSDGKQFWTGTKRRPRAADWGSSTPPPPQLMEYLYCTSNMYAFVWGLEPVRDRAQFEQIVSGLQLQQPEWTPPTTTSSVDLSDETDQQPPEDGGGADEAAHAEKLKADLHKVDVSSLQPAKPHDFEKDDDSNFHIDFLTIATNLRAWNYDIKASQRHTVKVTAGRIIPALATTTAMVCGLVDIEFCKLVLGLQSMGKDKFLNSNINLAAGSGNFTTYTPDPPVPLKTGLKVPESFSSWDKIEIASSAAAGGGELSVEDLVLYLEKTFGVTVDRIFAHGSTNYQAIYKALDKKMLDWEIVIGEDGKPAVSSDAVFALWPQIRMAVQMLGRLPPTSGQRKVFEKQVDTVKASLEKTKESFASRFHGPVSKAYLETYRPQEDGSEEQVYFDAVFAKRDYIKLAIHCGTPQEPDVHLPCIKYVFDHHHHHGTKDEDGQALKRLRVED